VALPRTLSLVWHRDDPYPREVAVERVYRDLEVAGSPARPRVIANMVQTLDGVVAVDGTAWTIGSDVDHYLFRTLRGWADAVLCGAGTLRRNDVVALTHPELRDARAAAGRTPNPAAVVVTRLAEFSDAVLRKRFFTRREFASVVVATDRAPAPNVRRAIDAGADVVIVPAGTTGEADPVAWLEALRARGFERILLEGGPLTNRAMVHAGVVEELFVTVTSRVAGRPDGVETRYGIFGGASASLEPISEYRHEAPGLAEWYLRSRVTPSTDR
jgi:riboflavin biosynthesis pyrimidine reductase